MKKLIIFILLIASPCFAFDFDALQKAIPSKEVHIIMESNAIASMEIIFHPDQFPAIQETMIQRYGIPRRIKGHRDTGTLKYAFTKCEWKQGPYWISLYTVHSALYRGAVKVERGRK